MAIDKLELYRWAVQDPQTHVAVLSRMFAAIRPQHKPRVLREDFSGTSAEAVAWVQLGGERESLAVDLDETTLSWAAARAQRLLGERASLVRFVHNDVLHVQPPEVPAADILSALNFSMLYFQHRHDLAAYLRHARQCLSPHGILVMNLFGGPGSLRNQVDRRRITPVSRNHQEPTPPPYEYQWEQKNYNPLTGRIECRIHFVVPGDGNHPPTTLRDAFVYDWRLWTLPELIDVFHEAGYADVQVWRHTYTPANKAEPVFLGQVHTIPEADTWLAYVIGIR